MTPWALDRRSGELWRGALIRPILRHLPGIRLVDGTGGTIGNPGATDKRRSARASKVARSLGRGAFRRPSLRPYATGQIAGGRASKGSTDPDPFDTPHNTGDPETQFADRR